MRPQTEEEALAQWPGRWHGRLRPGRWEMWERIFPPWEGWRLEYERLNGRTCAVRREGETWEGYEFWFDEEFPERVRLGTHTRPPPDPYDRRFEEAP